MQIYYNKEKIVLLSGYKKQILDVALLIKLFCRQNIIRNPFIDPKHVLPLKKLLLLAVPFIVYFDTP